MSSNKDNIIEEEHIESQMSEGVRQAAQKEYEILSRARGVSGRVARSFALMTMLAAGKEFINPEMASAQSRETSSETSSGSRAEAERVRREYRAKRFEELNGWGADFGIAGLTFGENVDTKRCVGEQIGVYVESMHKGDLLCTGGLTFSKEDLRSQVKQLLAEKDNRPGNLEQNERRNARVKIVIDPEASAVMLSTGIILSGERLVLDNDPNMEGKHIGLYGSKNARVELHKSGKNDIIIRYIEKEGDVYEYTIRNGVFDPKSQVKK